MFLLGLIRPWEHLVIIGILPNCNYSFEKYSKRLQGKLQLSSECVIWWYIIAHLAQPKIALYEFRGRKLFPSLCMFPWMEQSAKTTLHELNHRHWGGRKWRNTFYSLSKVNQKIISILIEKSQFPDITHHHQLPRSSSIDDLGEAAFWSSTRITKMSNYPTRWWFQIAQ